METQNQISIVFMVAGMSSRFGGKIKQFAKVTENQTLIEYSLNQAIKAGFNKIILIVGNLTEKPFKEKFGSSYNGIPIYYALQTFSPENRDRPWGTADALVSAKPFIESSFVVCNGDDLYGENTFKILFNHLKENKDSATISYKLGDVLSEKGTVNRGIFQVEQTKVKKITETFNISKENLEEKNLSPDDLCSQNIFALHAQILDILEKIVLDFKLKHTRDRKAECLLPSELSNLIELGKINLVLYSTPDKWIGVTNPEDEEIVRNQLKLLKNNF